jgi:ubiquinone/menaquinone biosynthesis C-methylase UbiE
VLFRSQYQPKYMTGLDYSTTCIDFCKDHYAIPGLSFRQGNAESLDFPDDAFDVVINVEASHNYNHMDRFIDEACRVLKPSGHLVYCDFRRKEGVDELRRQFIESGFMIIREKVITPNVIKSLDETNNTKKRHIDRHVPFFLRPGVKMFCSFDNTPMNGAFKKGELEYVSFILQKE